MNFGGEPEERERYLPSGGREPGPRNRRAEMWARSKEWLEATGGADIPDSDSLQADACAPSYSYDINQRLVLESKEHMRNRGMRSPDALTFAEPVREPRQRAPLLEPGPRMIEPSSDPSRSWLAI